LSYISVRHWRRFQHYDPGKRQPPWIKLYTELLDNEDYLGLSLRRRAILHGIWLSYARSRCVLGASSVRLGRMIGETSVQKRDLNALVQAGFIEVVASKELAEGYQSATPEVETEAEVELLGSVRNGNMERRRTGFEQPILRDVR
jgi:hypothetical protein